MGQQKSRRKYSGSIPAAVLFRSFHPRRCRLPPLLLIPHNVLEGRDGVSLPQFAAALSRHLKDLMFLQSVPIPVVLLVEKGLNLEPNH